MGAKQSKRSVDISGKEAEGGGEVAAAGAGAEGRVEQLADVDALKPQLNGDAHIHEHTDKEKQLDSGTPENEKDATTEKETKEQENGSEKEKEEVAPVTNGDSETKVENGESTPAPEEGKKPKKEKVKKKWSLRSISFSRKDKPKQEKKQKEEEPKTNGEPEKVPEEAAEVTPEIAISEVVEEAKSETEIKEEKTPETPVTEPLTNGSTTPESPETPKVETPAAEEPAPPAAAAPAPTPAPVPAPAEPERQEPVVETAPEQLPVNGLSLEEAKPEAPEVAQTEESKPEEKPAAETTETVAAPEIPVKIEVCVEQMPLESTPPPLPANPPPSSVASFAATTMAPELTDASLANTADLIISAPHSAPDTRELVEQAPAPPADLTNTDTNVNNTENIVTIDTVATELPPPLKESFDEQPADVKMETPPPMESDEGNPVVLVEPTIEKKETPDTLAPSEVLESNVDTYETVRSDNIDTRQAIGDQIQVNDDNTIKEKILEAPLDSEFVKMQDIPVPPADTPDSVDDLPPPPPMDDEMPISNDVVKKMEIALETVVTSNHVENTDVIGLNTESFNGDDETQKENLKNKTKDLLGEVVETIECNGTLEKENVLKQEMKEPTAATENGAVTPEDSAPPSLSEANESLPASEAFPPPPSELDATPPASPDGAEPKAPEATADTPQEPLPVSDKLADLIPEVPVVPELKTETLVETTSDVAVAN